MGSPLHLSDIFFLPCLCELQQDWKWLVGLLGRTLERPKQQQFLTYRAVLAYSSSRAVRTGTESQVNQPQNHGKDNYCVQHGGSGELHAAMLEEAGNTPEGLKVCIVLVMC